MNVEKLKKLASDARVYWSRPMPGRYMPFKEITAYSVGGIGVYFLMYCIQQLILSTTNLIIGNAIGIEPNFMYLLYAISIVISFPATGLRASIIDNARSKKGKYRPYLLSMAFPTAAIAVGMVMVPYEKIESQIIKGLIVLLFNVGIQFFYYFFYDSYENLIMVLSPDTQERADVLTVKSVVYSLAPSIATAVLPLVAKLVTDDGSITDLNVYRILFPPFAVLGIICSVYIYANTQEKIVQAKRQPELETYGIHWPGIYYVASHRNSRTYIAGFYARVMTAYNFKCAISGTKTRPVLEVAHIQPFYDHSFQSAQNGIVLRCDFNKLFSLGYLTLEYKKSDEIVVHVSDKLTSVWGEDYLGYEGKALSLPENPEFWPKKEYIEWHQKNCFEHWLRVGGSARI